MPRRTADRRRKLSPKVPQAVLTEAQRAGLMPLDWMLFVMRDEAADAVRRDKMAIAAAQYCHKRMADTRVPLRERAAKAADTAGAGTAWEGDLDGGWSQ